MTDDTHNPAPGDHEPEEQFAEEPAAAEGETWHGGPPDDADFGDDTATEATTVSEEAAEPAPEADLPETGKERNFFLPAVATMGGILLLGVLAYWQFGDALHGDQQPAPMVITQPAKPKPALSATTTPSTPTSPAEGVAPKTDLAAPATGGTASSAVAIPSTPPPAPTAPAPDITTTVKIDNSAAESRLAALSARVEDLQKSLDQATQQLSQISSKLAASQTAPVPPPPSPALEDRLNGIEQKLMQMQNAAPVSETQAPPMAPETETIAPPAMPRTPHKTTHHKMVKTVRNKANVKWVLRAASPNEAWVAKDSSTPDLQPVHIGDNVPGIGLVTAIREENGLWVVDGTKGTIH
jgi:hypothetical protein